MIINWTLRHTPKIRTESSKIFVANFLSCFVAYQTQKTEQDDTSAVATPTTLNAPVLSTVLEISRWSIHCYGPTMAALLFTYYSEVPDIRHYRITAFPVNPLL